MQTVTDATLARKARRQSRMPDLRRKREMPYLQRRRMSRPPQLAASLYDFGLFFVDQPKAAFEQL